MTISDLAFVTDVSLITGINAFDDNGSYAMTEGNFWLRSAHLGAGYRSDNAGNLAT